MGRDNILTRTRNLEDDISFRFLLMHWPREGLIGNVGMKYSLIYSETEWTFDFFMDFSKNP